VSPNGPRRTVRAAWASDASDIVTVSTEGEARALKLGKTTIRATYEALAAAGSIRVVPDFEGAWKGNRHVTNCLRLSGLGPDVCRFELAGDGAVFPFAATVTQNGASVVGTLDFRDNTGLVVVETGHVDGTIDESFGLVLTGTTSAVDRSEPSQSILNTWRTELDVDGNTMKGRFTRTRTFQNFWGAQHGRRGGRAGKASSSPGRPLHRSRRPARSWHGGGGAPRAMISIESAHGCWPQGVCSQSSPSAGGRSLRGESTSRA
jgi:hypothetical protein